MSKKEFVDTKGADRIVKSEDRLDLGQKIKRKTIIEQTK